MPDKHTPTPWRRGQSGNLHIYGPDGMGKHSGLVAEVSGRFYDGERAANAALIVRAVNRDHLFGELVETMKAADLMIAELADWFTSGPDHEVSVAADAEVTRRVIRALIAKVEAGDA